MIERFKSLMDQLQLSSSEFADRIGVQRSSISHILSGRNKPSVDFLEKILIAFPDIDLKWLISGKASSAVSQAESFNNAVKEDEIVNSVSSEKLDYTKTPAPLIPEPVEKIILVYRNNSFRILNPADQ